MKFPYRPPAIAKKLFKDFHWKTTNSKILITFDDGPSPESTESVLEILNNRNLKSIFFCIGQNIEKCPELCERILEQGSLLANHTFNHKRLPRLSKAEAVEEVVTVNNLLLDKFNIKAKYFRPPHGVFGISTKKLLENLRLENVMWSLLTCDYTGDLKTVKRGIEKHLMKDSIVVFHDSKNSKEIIDDSINYLLEAADSKGFEIGEPEECLK